MILLFSIILASVFHNEKKYQVKMLLWSDSFEDFLQNCIITVNQAG